MPLPVALSYSGTAVSTTTSSTLSSIDTSVTLTAVTGWPSSGTFFVAIDPGLSSEEKCLATRAGSTLTLTRAQDGTTGVAHVSGSVIVHVFTAVDAAAANLVASKLTTKGDVLATDGSTLNRLAVGTDAYVLTADAASTNGFKWAVIPAAAAGRNLIINGNMEIAQRGTTASVASGGGQQTFGADRFWTDNWNWSAGSNLTVSQDTSAPTGFHRSYKIATGATGLTYGSGGRTRIVYRVEGFDISPNYTGNVVLSFWVRSSITGTYNLFLENADFGSSTTTRAHTPEYTISVADTWEKKTVIIAMATATASGAWSTTNTIGLGISWMLGAHANRTGDSYKAAWTAYSAITPQTTTGVNWATNANATFHLSGVQLEAGSVVTPFEQRHVAAELALCQRYYYRLTPSGAGSPLNVGLVDYTTGANVYNILPVAMRIAPTALEQSGTATDYTVRVSGGVAVACNSVPTFGVAIPGLAFTILSVASGLTAGQACAGRAANASAFLGWSAEL